MGKPNATYTGQKDAYGHRIYRGYDGYYYIEINGVLHPTMQTEILKAMEIARNDPRFRDGGPTYEEIIEDGMQKIGNIVTDEIRNSGKAMLKAMAVAIIGLLAAVGFKKYSSEIVKDPTNRAGAAKKAGRNVACYVGMGVIAIALIILESVAKSMSGFPSIIAHMFVATGVYSLYGLFRVMRDKSFLIHIKLNNSDAKLFPKWVYFVIVILSGIALTKPILMKINDIVSAGYEDLTVLTKDQLMRIGACMLAASIAIAIAVGVIISLILRFLNRHISIS